MTSPAAAFSASTIRKAKVLAHELGGAIIGAGVLNLLSLWLPTFMLPAAIWCAIFYAFATIEHVKEDTSTRDSTIALVSDFFIELVLGGKVAASLIK